MSAKATIPFGGLSTRVRNAISGELMRRWPEKYGRDWSDRGRNLALASISRVELRRMLQTKEIIPASIPGLGDGSIRELMEYFGAAEQIRSSASDIKRAIGVLEAAGYDVKLRAPRK